MVIFYYDYCRLFIIISAICLLALFFYVIIAGSRFGLDLSIKYPSDSFTKLEVFFYSIGSAGAIVLNIAFWIETILFVS